MMGADRGRRLLCCLLLCANLIFIWGNSLLPAQASQTLSQWIADLLRGILPFRDSGTPAEDGWLRKAAHFCEFCSLGVLLTWLTAMHIKRPAPALLLAAGLGMLAACIDELLQHFSAGRNPSGWDVLLDTAGVAVGICLMQAGKTLIKRIKSKPYGGN